MPLRFIPPHLPFVCSRLIGTMDRPEQPVREDRDEENSFTLPSGRTIGYARYGVADSAHPPIIYSHGYPSSRTEAAMWSKDLFSSGLRLIAVDRPGYGLSTQLEKPVSERNVLDFATDIQSVADHLKITQFHVMGLSGGGPTAFATGYLMPERILSVIVVAGFASYAINTRKDVYSQLHWLNKLGLTVPYYFPGLYRWGYGIVVPWFLGRLSKATYEKTISTSAFKKAANTPDGQLLLGPDGEEFYNDSMRNIKEATRQSDWTNVHVDEMIVVYRDWPFQFGDIKVKNVRLFYGDKDAQTPYETGVQLQNAIGGDCALKRIEGGTHATVAVRGVEWICETLGIAYVKGRRDESGVEQEDDTK